MNLLLDTHTIIWMVSDDPRLRQSARDSILNAEKVHWSLISLWEIAIKASLDRPDFQLSPGWPDSIPREMAQNGFHQIPLTPSHFEIVSKLPFQHRDPFDRLLIATAITENLTILTDDQKFNNYDVPITW